LLGYTGIVSFAHTMFFGIGAYGVAIASSTHGSDMDGVGAGHRLCSLLLSFVLALLVGLVLAARAGHFFSMITLAVAAAFLRRWLRSCRTSRAVKTA
jgi:branched-chain amino acid transport system permease protein